MARHRLLGTLALLGIGLIPVTTSATVATPCQAIADRGPQLGRSTEAPPPAPALFARDFKAPLDCEWGFPIGGFGGIRREGRITHDPVIFVHGNHSDAVDWFGVADAFKAKGTPTDYDDTQSPRLAGAVNLTYPDAYHSDLRVRPDIVATYQAFLARHGSIA